MKRTLLGILLALVSLVLAGGGTYAWYDWRMTSPVSSNHDVLEVVIPAGANFDTATELLVSKKLVLHPLLFKLRARQRSRRLPIHAGMFKFQRDMTHDMIMDKLAKGPDVALNDVPLKFRVIDGHNIWNVAEHTKALGLDGDLLEVASSSRHIERYGLPAPRRLRPGAHSLLEGYLFPETYFIKRNEPRLDTALRLATRQFRKVFGGLKKDHAASVTRLNRELKLTDHDLVTLASLVQKETSAVAEAPMIAGVFYNRLRKKMKLQTDPTLVYGPTTWRELPSPTFRRDASNPYNTYAHRGLPPGPICNPGKAALRAVMAPAKTDALFFVARRDGTGRHVFARTLAEHNKNIDKYLRR